MEGHIAAQTVADNDDFRVVVVFVGFLDQTAELFKVLGQFVCEKELGFYFPFVVELIKMREFMLRNYYNNTKKFDGGWKRLMKKCDGREEFY